MFTFVNTSLQRNIIRNILLSKIPTVYITILTDVENTIKVGILGLSVYVYIKSYVACLLGKL